MIEKTFTESGAFAASRAAEKWCADVQIEFPQPMVEAPRYQSKYFYPHKGCVYDDKWGTTISKGGHAEELAALARGELYATAEDAKQRIAYDAQQMRRLVIPAWFRVLAPDVQMQLHTGEWIDFDLSIATDLDWSQRSPIYYRSKPRDVVVTVNGKEFRWPATATINDSFSGDRFRVSSSGVHCVANIECGPYVHHTRTGAESQLAAIRAAAGVAA